MKKIVNICLIYNERIRIFLTRPFAIFVSVMILFHFCFKFYETRQGRERREEQEVQISDYRTALLKELRDLFQTSKKMEISIMKSLIICTIANFLNISLIYNERVRILLTQPLAVFVFVAILLHYSLKLYQTLEERQRRRQEMQAERCEIMLLQEIRNHVQEFQESEIVSVIKSLNILEWGSINTSIPPIRDHRMPRGVVGVEDNGKDDRFGGIFSIFSISNPDDKVMTANISKDKKATVAANSEQELESFSRPRNNEDDEGEVCAICLDTFVKGELVCEAKNQACSHQFHGKCLTRWLLAHERCCRRCPVCRGNY